MTFQYGVKLVPPFLFIITGSLRLAELRYVAVVRNNYSKNFILKVVLCLLLALMYLSYIPINYATNQDTGFSSWLNKCGHDGYSWFNLIPVFAWSMSAYLLMYEYKRHMVEATFSNKMFWVLNLTAELITVAALHEIYFKSWFMAMTVAVAVLLNGTLVILMAITKRPVYSERLPVETLVTEPLVRKKGCYLEVTFQPKAIMVEN
jgi:hypothetical protein